MAEPGNTGGGNAASEAMQQVQVRVVAQYIKDLSFENPNIRRLLANPGDKPNLRIEVKVNAEKMGDKMFESAIEFKAEAASKDGVFYDLELTYAGLFQVDNMPEQALEPFLLINCPTLVFPFLRRLVADLTREGGFPPLMLDPIDFAQIYLSRQQQVAAAPSPTVN
jgi:preprotein translocase subunit SecB